MEKIKMLQTTNQISKAHWALPVVFVGLSWFINPIV